MSKFNSESVVEEVRRATDIVDVISQYVRLQKRGKNFLGLCPFHSEKTPSFNVDREKGLYYCFGCGAGGNVFTFLTQHDKISFGEALKQLAARASISLPSYSEGGQNEVDEITDVNEKASSYYRDMLYSDEGAAALEYLREKRHFEDETIRMFLLGYAPDRWDGLLNFLKKRAMSETVIEKAGLILKRQDGSGYYDRFRGRVMFPIQSAGGAVIAFGGRTLKAEESAKYINSPETAVYLKRKSLYGIYHSRDAIIEKDAAILVEGYADLIALFQAGFRNVVASSGTSLTGDQISYISRFTKNVYLVYDADVAGQDASLRGADILLEQGINVYIAELPAGEDPDTFVLSYGADEFMKLIQNAMNVVEFKANLLGNRAGPTANQVDMIRSIVDSLAKVSDAIKVNVLVKDLAQKFGLREDSIYQELKKKRTPGRTAESQPEIASRNSSAMPPSEVRELIILLLNVDETLFEIITSYVENIDFQSLVGSEIVRSIIRTRRAGKNADSVFDDLTTEEARRIFAELAFSSFQRSKVWTEELRPGSDIPNYLKWATHFLIDFEKKSTNKRRNELVKLIGKFDSESSGPVSTEYDRELKAVNERLNELNQAYTEKELLESFLREIEARKVQPGIQGNESEEF